MSGRHQSDAEVGAALRRIAHSAGEPTKELPRLDLVTRVPELAGLAGVPQDPSWHPEGDVLTHSLLAVDEAAKLWDAQGGNAERREVVVLAALFHDVGKPSTTVIDGGSVTSRGHAEVGGRIVLAMGERLAWPSDLAGAVAALVRYHMAHVSVVVEPSRRAVNRLCTRLADAGTSLDEWSVVVAADGAARGTAAMTNRAEPWLRVASTL